MTSLARNERQRDLVPAEKLNETAVVIIGVGAIGRQVATLVAAMGAPRVTIIDPDVVGVENLAVQGYKPDDIDKPKVDVMQAYMESINPNEITVLPVARKYTKYLKPCRLSSDSLVVFCCVDSIEDRTFIWNQLREATHTKDMGLFVDGRMAAETLRVLTWKKDDPTEAYSATLFPGAEAHQASCTGRSTLYSSYLAAGLMVGEFVKWMRGNSSVKDQMFNMSASEHTVLAD